MMPQSTEAPPSRSRGGNPARQRILRFDRLERATHWANATLFTILIATALPLYFPAIESIVGRRALIAEIHLYAGVALPVPLLLALAGPWGTMLRADIRRFNVWTVGEVRWLKSFGGAKGVRLDKFNPGQKLNAIFTAGVIVVMLATGLVMHFFNTFPVSWRTGATFVHDVVFFGATIVIIGHIAFAFTHLGSLRSIFRGWVSESWAEKHAPAWLEEEPERLPQ
jgi:formate dehydrogenase gamma subunit